MIPKKIHYIWFGGNALTPLAKKCIASWREYMPDYEIICWNESSFGNCSNRYFLEALAAKKWAFASDYGRLNALIQEGGIYMDTDVELIRHIDDYLLAKKAIFGFESSDRISTAFMAAEPQVDLLIEMKRQYEKTSFIKSNGSLDQTTNVVRLSSLMSAHGFNLDGTMHEHGLLLLCPTTLFNPKDWYSGRFNITQDTYAIHHFDGSWATGFTKVKNAALHILGENVIQMLKKVFIAK